ncbi:hypothetical protein AAVH_33116, partial [Aphelenchoides avenae]
MSSSTGGPNSEMRVLVDWSERNGDAPKLSSANGGGLRPRPLHSSRSATNAMVLQTDDYPLPAAAAPKNGAGALHK